MTYEIPPPNDDKKNHSRNFVANSMAAQHVRDTGLFQSIKQDLTTLIQERQQLSQRKELEIGKLKELNRKQKEEITAIANTRSALLELFSEGKNQLQRDTISLNLELESSKASIVVLSQSHDEIIRRIAESKTALEKAKCDYSSFVGNAKEFIDSSKITEETIQKVRKEKEEQLMKIKLLENEQEVMKVQKEEIEKDIGEIGKEQNMVIERLKSLSEALNEEKEIFDNTEEEVKKMKQMQDNLTAQLKRMKDYEFTLKSSQQKIAALLDEATDDIKRYDREAQLQRGELETLVKRKLALKQDLDESTEVFDALEGDIFLRTSRIKESEILHLELSQYASEQKEQLLKLENENKEIHTQITILMTKKENLLTKLQRLKEFETALIASCEKDSSTADQLSISISQKRTKLSEVEKVILDLKECINERNQIRKEVSDLNSQCQQIRECKIYSIRTSIEKNQKCLNQLFLEKQKLIQHQCDVKKSFEEKKEKLRITEIERSEILEQIHQAASHIQELTKKNERMEKSNYISANLDKYQLELQKRINESTKELKEKKAATAVDYNQLVQKEIENIRIDLQQRIEQVKQACETSTVKCSKVLAERLRTLRQDLDSHV